jgi:hypothetical protein
MVALLLLILVVYACLFICLFYIIYRQDVTIVAILYNVDCSVNSILVLTKRCKFVVSKQNLFARC